MIKTQKSQTWLNALYIGIVFLIMAGFFVGVGQQVLSSSQTTLDSQTKTNNQTWNGTSATTGVQLAKTVSSLGVNTGGNARCIVATSIAANNGSAGTVIEAANYTLDSRTGIFLFRSTSEYASSSDWINLSFTYHNDAWCNTYEAQLGNQSISDYFGIIGTIVILSGIIAVLTLYIVGRFM